MKWRKATTHPSFQWNNSAVCCPPARSRRRGCPRRSRWCTRGRRCWGWVAASNSWRCSWSRAWREENLAGREPAILGFEEIREKHQLIFHSTSVFRFKVWTKKHIATCRAYMQFHCWATSQSADVLIYTEHLVFATLSIRGPERLQMMQENERWPARGFSIGQLFHSLLYLQVHQDPYTLCS